MLHVHLINLLPTSNGENFQFFLKISLDFIANQVPKRHLVTIYALSPGPGGASETGAEGGGPRPEGGPQEDAGHPETAVGAGAADAAL